MPKTEIDYSNTIIYKIVCKDENITDTYVGHTTNFVQRKHAHKQGCINTKCQNYNCKLYKVLRENGGWDNWSMIMLNFFNCKNGDEARKKEQEYYEKLDANLNSVEPSPLHNNRPKFYCEKCNIYTNTQKQLDNHYESSKHINISDKMNLSDLNNAENSCKFKCVCCVFNSNNKNDFKRHCGTVKHKTIKSGDLNDEKTQKSAHKCLCGKIYKYKQGLSVHKKKCTGNPDSLESINLQELVIKLLTDNQDMKKVNQQLIHTITDMLPKIGNITNNNNN